VTPIIGGYDVHPTMLSLNKKRRDQKNKVIIK